MKLALSPIFLVIENNSKKTNAKNQCDTPLYMAENLEFKDQEESHTQHPVRQVLQHVNCRRLVYLRRGKKFLMYVLY